MAGSPAPRPIVPRGSRGTWPYDRQGLAPPGSRLGTAGDLGAVLPVGEVEGLVAIGQGSVRAGGDDRAARAPDRLDRVLDVPDLAAHGLTLCGASALRNIASQMGGLPVRRIMRTVRVSMVNRRRPGVRRPKIPLDRRMADTASPPVALEYPVPMGMADEREATVAGTTLPVATRVSLVAAMRAELGGETRRDERCAALRARDGSLDSIALGMAAARATRKTECRDTRTGAVVLKRLAAPLAGQREQGHGASQRQGPPGLTPHQLSTWAVILLGDRSPDRSPADRPRRRAGRRGRVTPFRADVGI